jgi:hypothetical protein
MKKAFIAFRNKELIFIVLGLVIGFVLANPCIARSDIEYGVCERFYSASFTEWIFKSLSIWFILKIGQGLGSFIHNCEEELQRKKDRESNLLEEKRNAVLLEHIQAVELGLREPDETYYRYWQSNHSSNPNLETIKQQESQQEKQKRLEERRKQSRKMAEALARGIRESKD